MKLNASNSPFTASQADELNTLIRSLSSKQKYWLSGYLLNEQTLEGDGHSSTSTDEVELPNSATPLNNQQQSSIPSETAHMLEKKEPHIESNGSHITVLYGTESGNAMNLAEIFTDRLIDIGHDVTLNAMDDFDTTTVSQIENLFIITSTHGEGDPPDNAWDFYDFLESKQAPRLDHVSFSVLALGDQTYEFFCQAGKDADTGLEKLGAQRLYPRVDCDIDYEEDAEKWMANVINTIDNTENNVQSEPIISESIKSAKEKKYSKSNPYYAEVLANDNLNGEGSNKETRHVELLLDNFGESYDPGDCIGVLPKNDPQMVDLLISMLGWDPESQIPINANGDTLSVEEALTTHFEITRLTLPLLMSAELYFDNDELTEQMEEEDWAKEYVVGRDLIDLLTDFPTTELQPENLTDILRKLPPREYSISSSFMATPDEVHLTVGTVRYQAHQRQRKGVCSVQFAERVKPGDMVPIYLKRNANFKFPTSEDIPVIMIGPGTGIAPFRSYLQEREELGLTGQTWLFFGEQHRTTDFLYEDELQQWLDNGNLSRLDLAFSRDTEQKEYVQHRILEHSHLFNEWLEQGAAIYICGDEKCMAKDVHQAIKDVLVKECHISQEEAETVLRQMKQQHRYQRDVY
ncbi:assimilatory sulfite reductase (NADPH) flavoprotein subunit [Staphylococcus simiae]|uniref:assimilatory sulfite reductase (NADPH) n=1 Tax=Staphylococcus simiae CCM 7213 = CCUG 51256 TaxID=911238 RepID=G5JKG4_9STAP|nr:assimilatory sulfite reductase (NADPH) flavoprotein subunit [Staphylococcus simiae]EHJ07335.1 sulfite reductase flavoprotein [Staphylococcus simiae CCM 7213 = CCUG 51256]PNZ14847.1 assimilatory sulfite reductase (NADPH) flavoprotein subunit [Staphylococcus simiae]SNV84132.1 Sulfite reductase (NADPH) alpha subunit [Staphylococcus simiae]